MIRVEGRKSICSRALNIFVIWEKIRERLGSVGVEGSVDERVDAGVGASVQEQELLDAVVDLVVGVWSHPEPESKVAAFKATLWRLVG